MNVMSVVSVWGVSIKVIMTYFDVVVYLSVLRNFEIEFSFILGGTKGLILSISINLK